MYSFNELYIPVEEYTKPGHMSQPEGIMVVIDVLDSFTVARLQD